MAHPRRLSERRRTDCNTKRPTYLVPVPNSGGSFFRHRITPTNVGRNRHVRRRLVSVRAGTARREHRWAAANEAGGGAAPRAFPHPFKRFPAEPPAASRGRRLPSHESERAPRGREQQSPPPPIEAMRCRSEATNSQRCAVGKRLAMRCRFAHAQENSDALHVSGEGGHSAASPPRTHPGLGPV